ncbi:hypothetical protein DFP73DRAFT_592758 [Morchella snyderi]|nr:hypothetical protein DFP73DRAFT_592758 [Morchella snyderi]
MTKVGTCGSNSGKGRRTPVVSGVLEGFTEAMMNENLVRHAFMRSTDTNFKHEDERMGKSTGICSSGVEDKMNSAFPETSSSAPTNLDDSKTLDSRLSMDRTHSILGVTIPYRKDNPPSSPSLPSIAPLHLQNTETYEQWVERERAEAIVKRRSLSEIERISPMKRRLYSPPCVSGVGSPPRCRQYINMDKDPDIFNSQYLPKLLDEPESKMESPRVAMRRARSKETVSNTSESDDFPRWTSPKGKGVADASEADSEDDSWVENTYNDDLVKWNVELNEFRSRLQPQGSLASTLTGAFTAVSEAEESLAQILTRLKLAGAGGGPQKAPLDLINQHINYINAGAGQSDHTSGAMESRKQIPDESPDFIFSPDGQAHINAELEELRKEAATYQSVRSVCTSPQLRSPNMLRIHCDPDKINYGTFEYVPFNINRASILEEGSAGPATAKISLKVQETPIGKITIESRPPDLLPKPKKKRSNSFSKVIDWIYEKFVNLSQGVALSGKRWHIPTQRSIPRGSSSPT